MLAQKWLTNAPWINYIAKQTKPQKLKSTIPTLATWGVFGIFAVTLFLEPVPLFRNDVLKKLPLVGGIWSKKLEDKARVD
jgi:hypothetical protein